MKKEKKEEKRVNVNNDLEMVSLGIRNKKLTPRDPSVWTKTDKEREAWKKQRRFPAPSSRWGSEKRYPKFNGRLILHVKYSDKTTYSHSCYEEDIPYIIGKYKSGKCSVTKVWWNGKDVSSKYLLQ